MAKETKIITFSNQKGGVGKTTTCINLAAYIALDGYKVLVIDMDPQGNASSSFGFFERNSKASLYEVLCDDVKIDDATYDTDIESLKIVPSSIHLSGAEIELTQVQIGREKVLSEKLESVAGKYDYVFIDCPPSLGLLTVNALTASSGVLIPIQSEYYALEGLSQMMNTIRLVKKHLNRSIEVEGVVLTMFDTRAKLSLQVAEEIEKFFGDNVFDTRIPRNVRLAEAPSYGKPVALYDKTCVGAKAYSKLKDEFLEKLEA